MTTIDPIEAAAMALFNWRDPPGARYWGKERTLAQARAAIAAYEKSRLEAASSDGWIPWHGGECPVHPRAMVKVKLRDGRQIELQANRLRWNRSLSQEPLVGRDGDIIAYEKAKAEASLDPDGWIPWHGGECPEKKTTIVVVKFSPGENNYDVDLAENFDWLTGGIVAYFVVKP